ncbi:hypothetical protein Cs7R123_24830 [Catellatospora sp. TT07R-123]|uniref:hypothetical protein n=1 Tax=Catellatospora sp. TT07R-123 TaxID=2733863 RepID=UPI001B2385D3|nr:hypothetical protein [Catellatospora sp. TT07R-123]GHJ45141.1 hypothetical protein Cs7R123_24830 [Catellatospora sp. TT07R-123]
MFTAFLLLLGAPAAHAAAHVAAPTPVPKPGVPKPGVPKPSASPDVKTIAISGDGITTALTISSTDNQRVYALLISEVDWLATRTSALKAPAADKLGPKFTVVTSVNGAAKQAYDLYPTAAGGPRVFRPQAQPDKRKVAAAWFYGRLSMPSSLRAAGVALGTPGPNEGGGGGGTVESPLAEPDIEAMVGDWQKFVGLNGAVVVVIAIGVFAIAYVLRRRV